MLAPAWMFPSRCCQAAYTTDAVSNAITSSVTTTTVARLTPPCFLDRRRPPASPAIRKVFQTAPNRPAARPDVRNISPVDSGPRQRVRGPTFTLTSGVRIGMP
jgi:hypothetical protein